MDQIEKAVIYIGSYFMLFIAATALQIIQDLPFSYDILVYLACIYITWARDEILAYHVIGFTITSESNKFVKLFSSIMRVLIGLFVIKMMILGFYQYVLIIYFIDYFTWVKTGRAISQVLSMSTIERTTNES